MPYTGYGVDMVVNLVEEKEKGKDERGGKGGKGADRCPLRPRGKGPPLAFIRYLNPSSIMHHASGFINLLPSPRSRSQPSNARLQWFTLQPHLSWDLQQQITILCSLFSCTIERSMKPDGMWRPQLQDSLKPVLITAIT